ncbi:hypothetical protein F4553_002086 [Allocatelliglobosispora scoriae]|uniref:Uncharacterized protein n=1 Tax=Allocatelliglobosispora scoriae TaxID=643052 RepID=A0A841BHX3_9ACTN|nr:hypothetical protein [Allocatelliglobosispora scoriae]MBB5868707.1 hypothetical protein [Allocatelliglobosispora scoriae]
MSTGIDVTGWLRRSAHWLRVEASIVALAVTALLVVVPLRGTPVERLYEQLDITVAGILEHVSPAEHHDHGHDVAAEDKIICVAETFGTDPADVRELAQVRWVYAYFLCASAPPGTDWDFASRISGPTAVSLTAPAEVRIAAAGLGYPDRVRAMIPDNLEARALSGFADKDLPDELRRRYETEISQA